MKTAMLKKILVGMLVMLIAPAAFARLDSDDYNFPVAEEGTEGQRVLAEKTGEIVATYRGNSAWNNNTLYLMLDAFGKPGDDGNYANDMLLFNNKTDRVGTSLSLGKFDAGTELIFRLHTVYWENASKVNEFFTGEAGRNADGYEHARVESDWKKDETLVSFEDLYGGLFDYNDMSFSFTNTIAAPVPEESTLILGLAGLGLMGWMNRRKKNGKA